MLKLDENLFNELILEATKSERKRAHFNLHADLDEPVQRLCIALKHGTYVRPHHHTQNNKWELILALRGKVTFVIFNENGVIVDKLVLSPGESLSGIELKPNTYHTIYPNSEDAIIFEVKEGPYTPAVKSDFAPWSPEEGGTDVHSFLTWLEQANVSDKY